MPFFTFGQNNSGGIFAHDPIKGIGYQVCIEAEDYSDANREAKEIGLYFDGVVKGVDCPCCGDRWGEQWSEEQGTDKPGYYGTHIEGGWGIPSYIHYASGYVATIDPPVRAKKSL